MVWEYGVLRCPGSTVLLGGGGGEFGDTVSTEEI
jgi:hypothetical protein